MRRPFDAAPPLNTCRDCGVEGSEGYSFPSTILPRGETFSAVYCWACRTWRSLRGYLFDPRRKMELEALGACRSQELDAPVTVPVTREGA